MNETNQPNESKKPPAPNSLSECRLDPLSVGCDKVSLLGSSRITVGPSVVRSYVNALFEAAFQAFPTA